MYLLLYLVWNNGSLISCEDINAQVVYSAVHVLGVHVISPADDEAIKLLNKLYRSLTAPEVTAEMNKDEETHISIAFNTRKNNTRLCSCHY